MLIWSIVYYAITHRLSLCKCQVVCGVLTAPGADKQFAPGSPVHHSASPPLQYQCLLCGTSRLLSNESIFHKTLIDKSRQKLLVSYVCTPCYNECDATFLYLSPPVPSCLPPYTQPTVYFPYMDTRTTAIVHIIWAPLVSARLQSS